MKYFSGHKIQRFGANIEKHIIPSRELALENERRTGKTRTVNYEE